MDLHTHSTASDGCLTPTVLVERACSLGLLAIALTDHDTVDGVAEACATAERQRMTLIPGVELSCDHSPGECHILGYFLDYRSPELGARLAQTRQGRLDRGHDMVRRLCDLGAPLSWERVQELAGTGTVTRSHVATALLEAGHVVSRQEAFDRYIGNGGPAHVARLKMSPEEAIGLITRARGVPVLAHPTYAEARDWTLPLHRLAPWPFLERLAQAGLRGLEAYYGDYPAELVSRLVDLANAYGLVVTGGSDFHGFAGGPALGSARVPVDVLEPLFCLAQQAGSPWMAELPVALRH